MNMTKKPKIYENIKFEKIIGGGQALGELESGKKIFAWGVLPDEIADIYETKRKSKYVEGYAVSIKNESDQRISPEDEDSYLSTSPWQIMNFEAESHYKSSLIVDFFELHNIFLPDPISIKSDDKYYNYRNKIEFSWWWDNESEKLDLAFFRRGTKGKIPVEKTSLAANEINNAAIEIRDFLRNKNIEAYDLKTLLIRSNRDGDVIAQLYVKEKSFPEITEQEFKNLNINGFEVIYSNPKSPASVITERLQSFGINRLEDKILGTKFSYSAEGFFQINLPVYEMALNDIKGVIDKIKPEKVIDLYAGVGSIGLSVTNKNLTLIEINESAGAEMQRNIKELGYKDTKAIVAPAEKSLDYIETDAFIILDPPRAGLHENVIKKIIEKKPKNIAYLSCNPATQARDIKLLCEGNVYGIKSHQGYNFFPRTPHIEHLVILERK